ncbi:Spermidine/spermine synthase [Gorgonomyces haynaldii]|nr:Spermidine/spermine synthase [Gorgonomyces haynaldii]
MSLQVKEVLFHERSKFQDVLVFESTNYGNVLVLDGVIQATERDEFAYQEMIAHLPLNAHPNPRKVLVIGGGDGGVLREIVKHDCVESVVLVEIDEMVPKVSKKYLPAMAAGFQHPKVSVQIADGFEYLKNNPGTFDVIITDSSDPEGPAEALFGETFFDLMRNALLPGGIVCTQGECQWLHLNLIKNVFDGAKKLFPVVEYAWAAVPTYPSGQIGFLICCNEQDRNMKQPVRSFSPEFERAKLKYYNSEVHAAAFVLPQFTRNYLGL